MRYFYLLLLLLSILIQSTLAYQTWEDKYNAWAATLEPGWVIEIYQNGNERCHCKVPGNQTSSSYYTLSTTATSISASTVDSTINVAPAAATTASTTTTPATTTAAAKSPTTTTATASTTTVPQTTTIATTTPTTTTPATTSTATTAPTTTPAATTTPTTTTMPVSCDNNIIISHGSVDYWTTPNYPNSYPEDYTCTLTVTIPATMPMALASITLNGVNEMYGSTTSSCLNRPDRLEVTDSTLIKAYYCGTLNPSLSWAPMTMYDAPKTITYKFISSSTDGGTASGLSFKIEGTNFMMG